MIDCSPFVLRVFVYPNSRGSATEPPPAFRVLLGDAVSSLSDLHGISCNWESARLLGPKLEAMGAGFVVVAVDGGAVHDSATQSPLESLLKTPMNHFPISVRARNCLHHGHLTTIRDVVSLTPKRISRLKNFGRITLNEIADLLSDLGLRLGMTDSEVEMLQKHYASTRHGTRCVNLNLLRNIDTIGCGRLSARFSGVDVVGEFIQLGDAALSSQLATEELSCAVLRLKELGVEPSLLDAWQKEHLSDLCQIFAPELGRFKDTTARCLELELRDRIATLEDRDRAIAIAYLGLDGRPTQTLEQVGMQFGLTRERVRQIVDKVRQQIGSAVPASLHPAIELVDKVIPRAASEVERMLVEGGLTVEPFRLETLKKVGELFGLESAFCVIGTGDCRVAVDIESSASVQAILSEARRRITHFGVTSVDHLVKTIGAATASKFCSVLVDILSLLPGLIWLDDSCEWFWSSEVPRNRIVSRLKKVFLVTKTVTIDELRAAVVRDSRTEEIDLPLPIFERFCRSCSDFLEVENGIVSCTSMQHDTDLSESETAIFVALRDQPTAIRRTDLKRACATVSDGTDAGLDRTISASPIIKSLGDGYYTLVGESARPMPDIDDAEDESVAVIQSEANAYGSPDSDSSPLLFDLDRSSEFFLWNAALRLLARANRLGLSVVHRRWSLVEINWSTDDLAVLRAWAKSGSSVGQKQRPIQSRALTQRQALALIFLAYCFDVARHHATEGELWPQVYAEIGEHLRSELFNGDRAVPRYWLQEATEDACRRFNIRHAFGREGAMGWLRTVYLQFGLTSSGLNRLPRWLAGAKLPVAITDLLEDPELEASDFRDVWTAIHEYRSGSLSRSALKQMLQGSPWFAWQNIDQLIQVTSEMMPSGHADDSIAQDAEDSELFLGRLFWTGPDPAISIEVSARWPADFRAQEYVAQFGEEYRATVRLSAQGSYSLVDFRIPLTEGEFKVTLFEKGTCVASDCFLRVLGSEDEIVFFDRSTGKRQDLWNLNLCRPTVLACRADLRVTPPAIRIRRVVRNSWVLHDFPNECPRNLKIELEEQLFWEAPTASVEKAQELPHVEIRLSGGRFGELSTAEVSGQASLTPTALIIGDQIVRHSAAGFRVRLAPINYDRIRAGVFVSEGSKVRKLRAHVVALNEVWGAALRKRDGSWAILNPTDVLDRQDFTGNRLFLRPPRTWGGAAVLQEDWALMEGSKFCARSRRQGVAGLDSVLGGVGEPLRLTVGPYNSSDLGVLLALSVNNAGLIQNIVRSSQGYRVTCSNIVDFGPDHNMWIWQKGSSEPQKLDRDTLSFDGRDLIVNVSQTALAFAVSFRGRRLGSRFVQSTSINELRQILLPEGWEQLACWTRWWQIPLLHPQVKDLATICVEQARLATFLKWVVHDRFDNMFYADEGIASSGWGAVVRELFWGWNPDEDEAAKILRETKLLTGSPGLDLTDGWLGSAEIASINPVLLVAIAARGMPCLYANISDSERRPLWLMFANIVAGLPRESGALAPTRTELFQRAVKELGTDSAFVRRVLLTEALDLYHGRRLHTTNLQVAIAVQPFRRWLVLELLDFLGKLK